jgi:hypothetical protein
MALPALLGLAALGTAIMTTVLKVTEVVFTRYLRKIAIMTVVIGGVYVAVNSLLGVIVTSLDPLLDSMPSIGSTMGMALPSNTVTCITAVITVELACIAYSLTIKALNFQAKAV